MLVKKQRFSIDSFLFRRAGRRIPIELGYETWGRLNDSRDNVVLICHYFTGTAHAAGKYEETDPLPGWWDVLIGPKKTIDTEKYFVIAIDCFSNINFHNPNVITTGPASKNPKTGKEYGMKFPIFTLDDVVHAQRLLLASLDIEKLHAVIGPSMGGLQAFLWGKYFPKSVGRIVSVVATPMVRPWCVMVPNQLGIDAIKIDPKWRNGAYYGRKPPLDGLLNAFKILLMATRTDEWAERNFGRKPANDAPDPFSSHDGKFLVQEEVEKIVLGRMKFFDPNSYLYIAKANALYDLRTGDESLKDALGQITAPVLMIIDESDLMFTVGQAQESIKHLPQADLYTYDSKNGHLSCLDETHYFAKQLGAFLAAGQ
ncbi:MAG: homoserine O-acetyltransferase [Candidatus Riflebacteria bacterium]|nr:homoserine O-acetyltransferase [Candidatus Riflebacteria bacterium]